MLNNRQKEIVKVLRKQNEWKTGKELSALFQVSDRTIRSDISYINHFFKDEIILSHFRYGYSIDRVKGNIILEGDDQQNVIPQTPLERCIYIIKHLLFEVNEINLTNLQAEMYVSEHTIENDLKRIRNMLKPYPELSLLRTKNYIMLQGREMAKRKLYKDLLASETQGNFLDLHQLAKLYKNFDLLFVVNILQQTLDEYEYSIREMNFPLLMVHVGIAIERMLQRNYVKREYLNEALSETTEYKIAKSFYEKIAKSIRIEMMEDEILLLALLLLGKRNVTYTNEYFEWNQQKIDTGEFIDQMLMNIQNHFDVDFTEDYELKAGLKAHIYSFIERIKYQIVSPNLFLVEIKKKYPLVFEMGVFVGRYIDQCLNISISESEIGFFALHLGAAYDRSHYNKKYQAVIIYPHDQAFAHMFENKIMNRFSERLQIQASFSVVDEKKIAKLQPDIIISAFPLQVNVHIPIINVSIFINNEDESLIFQALNEIDKKQLQFAFMTKLSTIIRPEHFYYNLEKQTPKDVIEYMCNDLKKDGIVDKEYINQVLEREKMSPTSFAFNFATPHSIEAMAKESRLSIAILKNPIQWGEYQVKLIFLLAIKEEDKAILKYFFDWLSMVVTDQQKLLKLIQVTEFDEFMDEIIS